MGNTQNLGQQEANRKMKDLAEDIRICMFCTDIYAMPFRTRPMGLQQVDGEGNFWFFSADDSLKNMEIRNNPHVQMIFAKPGDSKFMVVHGVADIVNDRAKTDELWNHFAKAWFKDGKDDPNLSLIRVKPETAHYWDTVHGKMIALIAYAVSAVTGKNVDEGVEGNLDIDK